MKNPPWKNNLTDDSRYSPNNNVFYIWRGWITSGLVVVPVIAGVIGIQLFDSGCMSGLPGMLVAAFGFCIGGIVNFANLFACFAFGMETPSHPDEEGVFLWGQGISILVFLGQVITLFALSSHMRG